ncbi:MAG TPA: hypothetical protein VF173_27090 [Thermoanaerobaculia bacterium]|nr:hypothetical protein [Thermoanaerobaculia bacterium]
MPSMTLPYPPPRKARGRRRIFRWFLIVLGVFALLGLAVAIGWPVWKGAVDRRLDATWRKSLGGPSFLERYPATGYNSTVRDLDGLSAAIGIDMTSPETPGRTQPTAQAAARFAAVKKPLGELLDASKCPTDGSLAPPAPALAAFLEAARPGLNAIRARLAQGPPPVWERDLSPGFETKIPNYLGVMMLQKLLLLDAHEQLRSGREAQAREILETSWQLNQALADSHPCLVTQLVAQGVLRWQQPILRSFAVPPAGWRARLEGLDLQSRIFTGLQFEAFSAHRSAVLGRPLGGEDSGAFPKPLLSWMVWDYSRRFVASIEEMRRQDVRSFDPDEFVREWMRSVPRWQFAARLLLPNFMDAWPRSVHKELEAELTTLVFAERERLAAGRPRPAIDRRPSRVKGLSWIYEETPETLTLHCDGELKSPETKAVPLRFTLRKG